MSDQDQSEDAFAIAVLARLKARVRKDPRSTLEIANALELLAASSLDRRLSEPKRLNIRDAFRLLAVLGLPEIEMHKIFNEAEATTGGDRLWQPEPARSFGDGLILFTPAEPTEVQERLDRVMREIKERNFPSTVEGADGGEASGGEALSTEGDRRGRQS